MASTSAVSGRSPSMRLACTRHTSGSSDCCAIRRRRFRSRPFWLEPVTRSDSRASLWATAFCSSSAAWLCSSAVAACLELLRQALDDLIVLAHEISARQQLLAGELLRLLGRERDRVAGAQFVQDLGTVDVGLGEGLLVRLALGAELLELGRHALLGRPVAQVQFRHVQDVGDGRFLFRYRFRGSWSTFPRFFWNQVLEVAEGGVGLVGQIGVVDGLLFDRRLVFLLPLDGVVDVVGVMPRFFSSSSSRSITFS
jgi:hypothetical protein